MKKFFFKAVSFDADGTLLGTFADTEKGFENFFLEAARSRGKTFTISQLSPILFRLQNIVREKRKEGYRPYVSESSTRSYWIWFYTEVFQEMGLLNPDQMAEEFFERYQTGEFTGLYPDVLPCLEKLKSFSIPMILISNFSPVLRLFLEKFMLTGFFKETFISGIEGVEKSDIKLFERGIRALDLPPSQILHVGDNYEEDYLAAQQAGFQAVLLDRENHYPDSDLLKISSLSELNLEQVFK